MEAKYHKRSGKGFGKKEKKGLTTINSNFKFTKKTLGEIYNCVKSLKGGFICTPYMPLFDKQKEYN